MIRRLMIVQLLVLSLLAVLTARLWYVQVMSGHSYVKVASDTRTREVIVPAVRGQILDGEGRPLVRNRTALVVSVDRMALQRTPDRGATVLTRLAAVLGRPYDEIAKRVRLCAHGVTRPCWPGSPYQPIPVDDRVTTRRALQILERQEDFPGVSAQVQAVRDYPWGDDAAQLLGYLQPVTQGELDRRKGLKTHFSGVDLVGRDGLEAMYDERLRGRAGIRRVAVDRLGRVLGTEQQAAPESGDTLITSIDANVQRVVEKALEKALERAPQADGAAGVVLDVRNGRVIALASLPTYNPSLWTGGISEEQYQRLLSSGSGRPLISRATHGEFAPASTFKVSSVAAAVADGYPLDGRYSCPGSFQVGNRSFRNFEGVAHGSMSLHRALVVSCDTIFYRFAYEEWLRDGGLRPGGRPKDPMQAMARNFGFGRATGIDLPNEAAGRIPDRAWKRSFWQATKKENCARARSGDPGMDDGRRADYLRQLANENCREGYVWRPGDAANFSIGQGDVLVTPLQLARAYAAIAGDGTLYRPQVGRALVRPSGSLVKEMTPQVAGQLAISADVRAYIRKALAQVPEQGTAAGAFRGFPLDDVPVAGKTGTAEVYGKRDTAWFASFAPADRPRLAVVVMISQGGTGGTAAAPAAREIYEGIFGVDGRPAALPGGQPPAQLPQIRPDGSVVAP